MPCLPYYSYDPVEARRNASTRITRNYNFFNVGVSVYKFISYNAPKYCSHYYKLTKRVKVLLYY